LTIIGLFSGRCFADVVALSSPLADALDSSLADVLPPLLLDARFGLSGWMLCHHGYILFVGNHYILFSDIIGLVS
jgi:hypothetical protein